MQNFHAHGYHQTSMGQIAAAVGMTAGSIYQHWRDKQELLDGAVQAGSEELLARVQVMVERIDQPAERLIAMLDEVVDFVTGHTALAAVARHDRPLASDAVRYRAERADGLVLAELVYALSHARRDLSEREVRATVHAVMGMVFSTTHTEPALDPERLARYLKIAVRAVTSSTPLGAVSSAAPVDPAR